MLRSRAEAVRTCFWSLEVPSVGAQGGKEFPLEGQKCLSVLSSVRIVADSVDPGWGLKTPYF